MLCYSNGTDKDRLPFMKIWTEAKCHDFMAHGVHYILGHN